MLCTGDEVCCGLQGIGDEEFDYPPEVRQGVGLVKDFLFDVIENVIMALTVALPLLEIVGHKRIKIFCARCREAVNGKFFYSDKRIQLFELSMGSLAYISS